MFKSVALILCALVFLAGCATTPNQSVPPVWTATNGVRSVVAPQTNQPPPVKTNQVPLMRSNPPPANVVAPAPVFTWMSLNRWAAVHKTGAPHLVSRTPVATYAIGSLRGVMVLEIGSREATWNGTLIHLGFGPELVDKQVFVDGLDLEKNFEPLLCGPPLDFGTNRVIVIDPGHGGMNSGTFSVLDKRPEKEFTLDWAKRLAPLLASNGWTVYLTRTNDTYVTNASRVVFAEMHHAALFISLHFNATPDRDKKTAGLETYCITPAGLPSTLTRGYADPWSEYLPNNNFDAQNLQLAVHVQSVLARTVGIEDLGVWRSRFETVLQGQNRPAILIEGGFLSNPREAALIESPAFRQKLAEALAQALALTGKTQEK
ncbi:MAG: N-acetylmuramoyl-L-alanine amidase [Verrucomicrobiota bacterium]